MRSSSLPSEERLIVGRESERGQLRALLERALAGRGSLVLVSGEAGIGKTTLVRTLAEEGSQRQLLILVGYCHELTTPAAFGPWADLASNFQEWSDLRPPAALLDGVGAADVESQDALFREIREFLSSVGSRSPAVLILEDMHWSDAASLDLLRYVARFLERLPFLIVVTYRIDELTPDHPLFQALPMLVREASAARIALKRLDNTAMRALVAAQYGLSSVDEHRLLTYLEEHSEGHPLYLRELLRTLTEEGILARSDGHWVVGDFDRIIVPALIHQLIEGRLTRLGEDTRDLLRIAAVIGHDVPFELWKRVSGAPESRLDPVIERALSAHILQESPDGNGYRFSHALVREALYSSLILTKRRMWHRRAGEALAEEARTDPEKVAHHFQQAGDPRAAGWRIEAAERAQALYALQSAIEHFTQAIEASEGLSTAEQIRALRGRGQCYDMDGHYTSARQDDEAALDIARQAGDRRAEWQALIDLGLVWASRDYQQTGACWSQALELARTMDDPEALARSLNSVGNWHVNVEKPFEAMRYHQEALAIFQELGDRRGVAETRDLLGMAAMLTGDLVQSAAHYRQAVTLLRETGDRRLLSSSLVNLHADSAAAMNMSSAPGLTLVEAQRAAEDALRIARDIGWRSGEAFALIHLGTNLAAQGTYGEAQRSLNAGLEIAEEIAHHQWTAIALWTLGSSYLDIYALAEARAYLERSIALCKHVGSLFMTRCASGFLALAYGRQGSLDDASRLLDDELDRSADPPTVAQRIQWSAYIELALARDQPEDALRIVDWMNASSPSHPGAHVPISLTLLRGRALTGLRRLQEAELDLQTARAGALEQGAGTWLHAIHLAFIRLYQAQARPQDAKHEIAAAHANARERAATIPDESFRERYLMHVRDQLALLADQPVSSLSRREIQVLRLVADGLTDGEIAQSLSISPRTVGQHLRSVYNKLGVPGRTAATRIAVERGIV